MKNIANRNNPKLIVILGPTASGKSGLAVRLAKKFRGEIISADSRQIYKGLDIGTGKITKREMEGVPHHLLSIVDPSRIFSVTEYKRLADKAVAEIIARRNVPFMVGGTGFYIDAVARGIEFPDVPPNIKLRTQLSKKSNEELLKILKKIDPGRAKSIDYNNPHRLIRAIEIARVMGKTPKLKENKNYDTLFIGVSVLKKTLKKKIHERLFRRMRQGMIREAYRLRRRGLSFKRFYELGLEYRFLADYLQKKIDRTEFVEQLETSTWHYAKRQTTWFKRNRDIHWIKKEREAEKLIRSFLKE